MSGAAFYLELNGHGLAVWTEGEGDELSIKVSGLHALHEEEANALRGRIRRHKPALLALMLSDDPDALAVLSEGRHDAAMRSRPRSSGAAGRAATFPCWTTSSRGRG